MAVNISVSAPLMKSTFRAFPDAQWLGHCTFIAEDVNLHLDRGTKIPQAAWYVPRAPSQKKERKRKVH